jgi:hypothetical protein
METGSLGVAQVNPDGNFSYLWSVDDGTKRSPITCVKLHDLLKDGNQQIIVGRDDGRLEVFAQDGGNMSSRANVVFTKEIGASLSRVVSVCVCMYVCV